MNYRNIRKKLINEKGYNMKNQFIKALESNDLNEIREKGLSMTYNF